MRTGVVIGSAALLLAVAARDARADGVAARRHFEVGKKLRDGGDCARAIPEFEQSIEADRSIGGYYNLGYCHEQLSHRQEAYEAYRSAQRLASERKDDRLREISGALAALLETPHIRLVLPQPLPDGIEIRVDDQLVPPSFYSAETVVFTRAAKTHPVSVTAPGHEERRETVETKAVKPIELRLVRRESPAPPPPSAPPARPEASAAGWTWQHWSGVGVGTAGVGLVTLASILFVSYRVDQSDLLERYEAARSTCARGCTAAQRSERDSLREQHNAAEQKGRDQAPLMIATAVGGGLMIAGGVLLFLKAPRSGAPRESTTGLRLTPLLGTTIGGALVSGSF